MTDSPPPPENFQERQERQERQDFAGRPDVDLPQAVAGAVRVRGCARLAALLIAALCAVLGGPPRLGWLLGALLGGLVVEINLSLLVRMLVRSPNWRGRSLWPTILRYYLAFGFTIIVCVVVVRNHWGQPLAFLLGLLSFFIGLALGLLSLAVKKPRGER